MLNTPITQTSKPPAIIAAVLVLAYFICLAPTLNSFRLLGLDEAHYAAIARHAAFNGHWLPLYWKGAPFFEKPPIYIWLQAVLLNASGTTAEWPIRLPALIAACVMWYYFILLAWKLSGSTFVACSFFVLGAFQKHAILFARCGTFDMPLLACLLAAVWELSMAFEEGTKKPGHNLLFAGLWCSAAVLLKTWFGLSLFIPAVAALGLKRPWPFKKKSLAGFFIPPVITIITWFIFSAMVNGSGTLGFEFGHNTIGRVMNGGLSEIIHGQPLSVWVFWGAIFTAGMASIWPALVPAIGVFIRTCSSEPGGFARFFLLAFFLAWTTLIYLFINPSINYFLPMLPLSCLAVAAWYAYAGGIMAGAVFITAAIVSLSFASDRINETAAFLLSLDIMPAAVLLCKKEKPKVWVTAAIAAWAVFAAAGSIKYIIHPVDQNAGLAAFAKENKAKSRNETVIWSGDPMVAQVIDFYSGYNVKEVKEYPSKLIYPAIICLPDGSYRLIKP